MAEHIEEPGAYSVFAIDGMPEAPLYLLSFDKQGICISPQTRVRALMAAAGGKYSDVHVYSHGWNNVFDEALAHYKEFFTEYLALQPGCGTRRRWLPADDHRYYLARHSISSE